MKGSLFLLIAGILGASAIQVPWYFQDTCGLKQHIDETRCQDYSKIIQCLIIQVHHFPENSDLEDGMDLLDYLDGAKEIEDRCPDLKKYDTCLDKEIHSCLSTTPLSDVDSCSLDRGISRCLERLQKKCDVKKVEELISEYKESEKDCQCGLEIEKCVKEFMEASVREHYGEMLSKYKQAIQCLDGLSCDEYGIVKDKKLELEERLHDAESVIEFPGGGSLILHP